MLGRVQVNNLNLLQGPVREVENFLLFTGRGNGTNEGKLIHVNSQTDLDAVLGLPASNLKTQVTAAQLNAGQNWNAALLPLREDDDWRSAVDIAVEEITVEGIALTDPIAAAADIERMQAKAESIMAKHLAPVWIGGAVRAPLESETWEDYRSAIAPITANVVADQVTLTASLWGHELGAYCGRLCNKSVTVADSPMRVKTGPLLGEWSERPRDADGRAIDMATLYALDAARISVPQWYPGYPGTYWSDGNVLDVPGGDYQVIENLRVIQKCMRQVYPLAVGRIGDRTLNETPESIAAAQMHFARPLREMSKSRKVLGIPFPGEIHPPAKDAVTLVWCTKYALEIWLTARPYNCPKDITCNLLLDLTNYA
jgi:hypothetical protein